MTGLAADTAVAVGEEIERLAAGEFLSAHREAKIGDRLVEEAIPRGAAGNLLFVQDPFEVVGKLMRPERTNIAQPGLVMGEAGGLEALGQDRVVDPVDFQREEQKRRRDVGNALLHRLVEPRHLGVAHVLGIVELGEAADATDQLLQTLVFGDRQGQCGAVEAGEAPLVAGREGLGPVGRLGQGFREIRRIRTRKQVGQVPNGQLLASCVLGCGGLAGFDHR